MGLKQHLEAFLGSRNSFRRPVAKLLSGSGLAFLIGYLAKPLVLRLYPVADFGVYEFVISTAAVLMPIASLRFEDAIVLPGEDRDGRDVLLLSALLTLATTLLCVAGVWILGPLVPDAEIRRWLWVIPVILLVMRVAKLGELWAARTNRFGLMSGATASQSVVTTTSRIGLGVAGTGIPGLLASFVAGYAVLAAVFGRNLLATVPRGGVIQLRAVARRYRRFPQFATPASLVSALGTRLPFLVLLGLFGAEVLGLFGQAFNVLFVPLSLMGTAVAQVFFVRAAEAHRTGTLTQATSEAYRMLASVGIAPLLAVCAVAPEVFGFLFGPSWAEAGRYAVWIAPWIALMAIASPLTRVFDVLEAQKVDLLLSTLIFVLVGGALWLSQDHTALEAMMLLSAAGCAGRLVQILVACRLAGMGTNAIVKPFLRPVLEGTFLFAVLSLAARWIGPAALTATLFLLLLGWGLLLLRRMTLLPHD